MHQASIRRVSRVHDLAMLRAFRGTGNDWLESLIGPIGPQGPMP